MKHENVKKMVALALLAALVVVLQTVASGIKVGPIPITLTLVPIVIGAVLYGPGAGAGLGAITLLGAIVLTATDYTSDRITAWLDPFADTSDTGYQIVQSLYAVGSGGFSGLGLGNSRQKYLYLPEEHNDFIFAVVCEELGFIGAALILALFALLICRGFYLAMHCRDRYSALVCAGITALLAFQVILNVAVVTNLIPCTGISLPFFSYGGTALLIQLAEMGVILSISRDIPEKKFIRPKRKVPRTPQNQGGAQK